MALSHVTACKSTNGGVSRGRCSACSLLCCFCFPTSQMDTSLIVGRADTPPQVRHTLPPPPREEPPGYHPLGTAKWGTPFGGRKCSSDVLNPRWLRVYAKQLCFSNTEPFLDILPQTANFKAKKKNSKKRLGECSDASHPGSSVPLPATQATQVISELEGATSLGDVAG